MLKAGKSIPQRSAWGRAPAQETVGPVSSAVQLVRSPPGRHTAADEDDDDGGEYLPAPSMASSWLEDIDKAMNAHTARSQALAGEWYFCCWWLYLGLSS